jgi:hypothetical protein
MRVRFTAAPVLPDAALLMALAPELAVLLALPVAIAAPVFPESPESPDLALPPTATAPPRIPELVAVGFDVAAPVFPVFPEPPDTATGLLTADDDAGPVFPVLVALDCDFTEPELPEVATGATLTVEPPPEPPLAVLTATLDPPAVAVPPPPPLPPVATTPVWFTADPLDPDPAVEPEPAPDEALLVAPPDAIAAPVEPESPEPPDVWAQDGVDCRSSTAKTATAETRMAQPSRLMFRMVAIFMRITSLPTWSPRFAPIGPRFRHPRPVVETTNASVASERGDALAMIPPRQSYFARFFRPLDWAV